MFIGVAVEKCQRCLCPVPAPALPPFGGEWELFSFGAGIIGKIDLLDFDRPRRSVAELDELLRRRINRRLVTLASVIEKVEALAESPPLTPSQIRDASREIPAP
jgi:hypothetical protein